MDLVQIDNYCFYNKNLSGLIEICLIGEGLIDASVGVSVYILKRHPTNVIVVSICDSLCKDIIPGIVYIPKTWTLHDSGYVYNKSKEGDDKYIQRYPSNTHCGPLHPPKHQLAQFKCDEKLYNVINLGITNRSQCRDDINGFTTFLSLNPADMEKQTKFVLALCPHTSIIDKTTAAIAKVCHEQSTSFITFCTIRTIKDPHNAEQWYNEGSTQATMSLFVKHIVAVVTSTNRRRRSFSYLIPIGTGTTGLAPGSANLLDNKSPALKCEQATD
jgi:nucleoside phosphorylase